MKWIPVAGLMLLAGYVTPGAHADEIAMRWIKLNVNGTTTTLQLPAATFKNKNALKARARKITSTEVATVLSGEAALEIGKGQSERFSMEADMIVAPTDQRKFSAKGHITFLFRQGDKVVLQITAEDATIEFGPDPTA